MPHSLKMDQEKIGFTRGVVYAIAQTIRYGHESVAEYLWNESGFTPKDLDLCDNYDVNELSKIGIKKLQYPTLSQ